MHITPSADAGYRAHSPVNRLPHFSPTSALADDSCSGQHGQAPAPIRRPFLIRFLYSTGRALLFLTLGAAIGVTALPSGAPTTLLALLSKPPTDAESAVAFRPYDAASAAVEAHVQAHPLTRRMRASAGFTESRPHMKVPEALRAANLTAGPLAGPGRIVVPPVIWSETGGRSMVSVFYLGDQLCGHPGIVHGGLLATLLDEGLARCCFPALPNKVGVTANLRVDYRLPTRAGGYFVLRAETVKVEGRKAWVKGWIETLVDEEKGEVPVRMVEAEALYIEPRNAKVSFSFVGTLLFVVVEELGQLTRLLSRL